MEKLSMEVVNAHAAGIDIGSRFHMVAVNQNPADVKEFGVYTADYEAMVLWLKQQGVTTIAMESTGSYWQTLFSALQVAGFEVLLVSGQHTRNIKGKKTDVQDCVWIQRLHSLGLLSGSFLPAEHVQQLKTYYYHRQHLIEQMSKYTNKLQKAFRLMNIRLDVVLNDITGQSGQAIMDAILAKERDPERLAALVSKRVRKSRQEIAKSLQGNWREDLLFEVKECLFLYRLYEKKLKECDKHLEKVFGPMQVHQVNEPIPAQASVRKGRSKHSTSFDIQSIACKHYGVDLFAIPSISYNTVLCLMSHISRQDMAKFASVKHFTSWLRLAPNNKKTGGKVISSRTPKGKSKIALALRQAANSVGNMKDHPLNSFFKRVAYRKGRGAAVTATARKLAAIIYHMITGQKPYHSEQSDAYLNRIKQLQIRNIKLRLSKLNLSSDEVFDVLSTVSILAT